jgi:CcmD family protein
MYDFLSANSLYLVLIIALICWAGIFLYLLRLDRRLSALEERRKENRQ